MSNYIGTNPAAVQLADPSLLITINATSTLNVQAYGKTFLAIGSGGFSTTLPSLSSGGFAGIIVVANDASSAITVTTTDAMRLNGASVTTVTILPGDSASFQNDASSWNVVSTSSKAPLVSPAFAGNPTVPTQSLGDSSTRISNTAWTTGYVTNLNLAPKVSPALGGVPTTPTNGNPLDVSNQIANNAFVQAAIQANVTSTSGTGWVAYRIPGGIQIITAQFTNSTGSGNFSFPVSFRAGTIPIMTGCDYGGGANVVSLNAVSNTSFSAWGKTVSGSYASTATVYTAIGLY